MLKSKSILVLGSNSFAGSYFVKKLIDLNHSVIGVSRRNEIDKKFLIYKNINYKKKFKFKRIDVNKNLNSLIDLIKKEKPSLIFNFMAQGMVEQSWKSPEDWYNTNLVSQSILINKIFKFNFIKKFIHFSTPEVYGSTAHWISENFNFMPTTPYAISRASFDMHLKKMHENFNFPVIITRTANIYGPGQQLFRIIPRAILFAINKKKLIIDGDGQTLRSFIHMDDVSNALWQIAKKGKLGETYHISTKRLITIKSLVKKIAKVTNTKLNISFGPERIGKDKFYKLNTSKIRNLGWRENISLKNGIEDTFEWIKNFNKNIINKNLTYYKHQK